MNNKFWLFERKHYLPRPIPTTGDLSLCRQLFPPTCNHRFRTSLSTRETYRRSSPLQTLGIQSIWQEPLPKAEYQRELTQWDNSYFKYTLIKKKKKIKTTTKQEAFRGENCRCGDRCTREGCTETLVRRGPTRNKNKTIQGFICGAYLLVKSN